MILKEKKIFRKMFTVTDLVCIVNQQIFFQSVNNITKEDIDQESIKSSTTSDPGYQWESSKLTIGHHKREQRGQPFPAGDHKTPINRHTRKHSKHTPEIT